MLLSTVAAASVQSKSHCCNTFSRHKKCVSSSFRITQILKHCRWFFSLLLLGLNQVVHETYYSWNAHYWYLRRSEISQKSSATSKHQAFSDDRLSSTR